MIENVPALVCVNCGEAYFDAETSRRMDRLIASPPGPRKTIEVPVYAFSD